MKRQFVSLVRASLQRSRSRLCPISPALSTSSYSSARTLVSSSYRNSPLLPPRTFLKAVQLSSPLLLSRSLCSSSDQTLSLAEFTTTTSFSAKSSLVAQSLAKRGWFGNSQLSVDESDNWVSNKPPTFGGFEGRRESSFGFDGHRERRSGFDSYKRDSSNGVDSDTWMKKKEENPSNIVLIKSEDQFNSTITKVQGKFISPTIIELSKKYPHVTTYKIDIDQEGLEAVLRELSISSVPTLHFYKKGKKAVEVVGADVTRLKATMESLYNSNANIGNEHEATLQNLHYVKSWKGFIFENVLVHKMARHWLHCWVTWDCDGCRNDDENDP
ncbi:Thioredoxin domain [Dillenia turbinata]|uniref:Thioredoxin domain n=1 Tax=Dillenia turbinata TaxID=194707 RepID=A0AAN8Z9M3_9MAGN